MLGRAVSVCVSATFVYSVEMNKRIFKLFSPSNSHTILVFFLHQTLWQYSDLLTGANMMDDERGAEERERERWVDKWMRRWMETRQDKYRDFRAISGIGIDDCSSVECCQQFRRRSNLQHQATASVITQTVATKRHASVNPVYDSEPGWCIRRREQNGSKLYALANLKP